MFEELPTLERMKLRRPDLYKDWNCPMCKNFPETFAHIWICSQHQPSIRQLIYFSKQQLVSLISRFVPDTTISLRDLAHDSSLWTCDPSLLDFNFYDLIKEFVPLELF